MSKATETELGKLHGVIAKVLTAKVLETELVMEIDEDGTPVETGDTMYSATPATLAVAIKFLKDNQITSDIVVEQNMSNLRDALSKKQKHSRLSDGKQAALKVVG